MKEVSCKRTNAPNRALNAVAGSPGRRLGWIISVLVGSALLAAAVRAYNHATLDTVNVTRASTALPMVQGGGTTAGRLHSRLSLQPEADRMRRRLGQRFVAAGKDRTISMGILTIGTNSVPVQIVRTQNDDGERVEIGLGIGSASLTWTAAEGAKSGAQLATGNERSLIERLVLDSPDQFVLAQLRGASYYTLAHEARPLEAGSSEDYTGPVWNVVRVGEPQMGTPNRPESLWRLYYINTSTGFIEKVLSLQGADTISAQVSGWVEVGGERAPTRITWAQGGQVVMELIITNITNSPAQ